MNIRRITEDGTLWAVKYDEQECDELTRLFRDWSDPAYLISFFKENWNDIAYFQVTTLQEAVDTTMDERESLEYIIFNIAPDADLDAIFRQLDNKTREFILEKTKGKMNKSWLRLYAIKLTSGIYIITGGAIKLTATMEERNHTKNELIKIDKVRNHLIANNVFDEDSFFSYMEEIGG